MRAVAFGDDLVKIKIERPYKIRMKENVFSLGSGWNELPEYLAIFLVGMGFASV